ncbi:MAG: tryptophan synthase subunit alpha [Planctomycetes bacterium]|nr:tryptophan synthase subunit alpha [Planctomycetota bacterium]
MSIEELEKAFATDRKALMPFLMSGHPTPESFARNLREAAEYADVIEVGVPFSDPLADGPVIQAAAAQALSHRTTLRSTLEVLTARDDGPPVVLMLSVNQVLAYGVAKFAASAKQAKVSGAIVPDLPFEESAQVREAFAHEQIALIPMLAPTTSDERKRAILGKARGFAYLISVAGVTGTRDSYPPETLAYIRSARELSPVPVCVGFGISKPQHIEQLRQSADGFIVGSALIRGIDEARSVADILKPLRRACDTALTGNRS